RVLVAQGARVAAHRLDSARDVEGSESIAGAVVSADGEDLDVEIARRELGKVPREDFGKRRHRKTLVGIGVASLLAIVAGEQSIERIVSRVEQRPAVVFYVRSEQTLQQSDGALGLPLSLESSAERERCLVPLLTPRRGIPQHRLEGLMRIGDVLAEVNL